MSQIHFCNVSGENTFRIFLSTYFLAEIRENETINNTFQTVIYSFRYQIWQFKLQKKIPSFMIIDTEVNELIKTYRGTSKKFDNNMDILHAFLHEYNGE